jgi:AraC-like DNA-binding protein
MTQLASSPENGTWDFAPEGWRQLYGSFPNQGISVEWHDFEAENTIPWDKSFHDESIEICLNLEGRAEICRRGIETQLPEQSVVFYSWRGDGLKAVRLKDEKHSFLTIEISKEYLKNILQEKTCGLCSLARSFLSSRYASQICPQVRPLNYSFQTLVTGLRQAPVTEPAKPLWFQCKVLELVSKLLFEEQEQSPEEFFCVRQKRVAQERVEKIRNLLREHLEQPLSLKDLGKAIGCSPFYLSRIFSQETGATIPKFIRQIRIEKAAKLLGTGKYNVTEAAMEVGYSSLSHFTKAFHETMGCCPGLYSLCKK